MTAWVLKKGVAENRNQRPQTYLENNDLPMAKEVLAKAIDYVKAEKIWKIGMCYQCGERILKSDFENLFFEHIHDHLLESSLFRIKF